MGEYTDIRRGGIASTLRRSSIPIADRELFTALSSDLLGAGLDAKVQEMLFLVVLRHHRAMSSEYPNHQMCKAVSNRARGLGITEEKILSWQLAAETLFNADNCDLTVPLCKQSPRKIRESSLLYYKHKN